MKANRFLTIALAVLSMLTIPGIQHLANAQSVLLKTDSREQDRDHKGRDQGRGDRDRNRSDARDDDDDRDDDEDRDDEDDRDDDDDRNDDRDNERDNRHSDSRSRRGDVINSRTTLPEMAAAILIDRGMATSARRFVPATARRVRWVDADRNGRPERATFYDRSNRIVQVWLDTNRDGRADRIQQFAKGKLFRTIR